MRDVTLDLEDACDCCPEFCDYCLCMPDERDFGATPNLAMTIAASGAVTGCLDGKSFYGFASGPQLGVSCFDGNDECTPSCAAGGGCGNVPGGDDACIDDEFYFPCTGDTTVPYYELAVDFGLCNRAVAGSGTGTITNAFGVKFVFELRQNLDAVPPPPRLQVEDVHSVNGDPNNLTLDSASCDPFEVVVSFDVYVQFNDYGGPVDVVERITVTFVEAP